MTLFYQILIKLVLMILLMSLQKTKKPPAGTIDEANVPQASESNNISIGYGTFKTSGNCVWYGDFDTKEIVEDGGFFGPDITVGYKYFLGLNLIMCHGITELKKIKMNEKDVWVNTGEIGNFSGSYDKPHHITSDNGVSGTFKFYAGQNNIEDPYLNGFIESPSFEGLSNIVFEKNYIGNSPTPPATQFILSNYKSYDFFDKSKIIIDTLTEFPKATLGENLSIKTPLNSSENFVLTNSDGTIEYNTLNYDLQGDDILIKLDQSGAVNEITDEQELKIVYKTRYYDLNPAVILYDILVSQEYGISQNPNTIDEQSFIDAQNILFDENFGLSLIYSATINGSEFVQQIEKHIAAAVVDDFYTGKSKLKLIRNDYDKSLVESFDETNIIEMVDYKRNGTDDLYSELKVEYTNKQNEFNNGLVAFQNEGLRIERATNTQSVTQQFLFCTTHENASKIAYREGIPVTTALARFEFTCFKILGLEKGDVVKIKWDDYEIKEMFLRVQEVNYGTFGDNKMRIVALQDTFGIQFTSYTGIPNSGFKPIDFTAKPMAINVIDCNKFLAQDNVNKILTYGSKPTSATYKYKLLIDEINAGSARAFTYSATIKESIDFDDNLIKIITDNYLDITEYSSEQLTQGANLCLITDGINQEFINFETKDIISGDQTLLTVKRGCCDTKPKKWDIGTNIYFISQGNAISQNISLLENQNIKIKGLTVTAQDVLKSEDASTLNYTMSSQQRNLKPIIAANMKVNNDLVFDTITIGLSDVLNLTWEYRKINSQNIVKSYFDIDEASNDDTEYRIIIKDSLGVVILDVLTTDNFYSFTSESPLETELDVEIISVKNGYESFDKHEFKVLRV